MLFFQEKTSPKNPNKKSKKTNKQQKNPTQPNIKTNKPHQKTRKNPIKRPTRHKKPHKTPPKKPKKLNQTNTKKPTKKPNQSTHQQNTTTKKKPKKVWKYTLQLTLALIASWGGNKITAVPLCFYLNVRAGPFPQWGHRALQGSLRFCCSPVTHGTKPLTNLGSCHQHVLTIPGQRLRYKTPNPQIPTNTNPKEVSSIHLIVCLFRGRRKATLAKPKGSSSLPKSNYPQCNPLHKFLFTAAGTHCSPNPSLQKHQNSLQCVVHADLWAQHHIRDKAPQILPTVNPTALKMCHFML